MPSLAAGRLRHGAGKHGRSAVYALPAAGRVQNFFRVRFPGNDPPGIRPTLRRLPETAALG